MRKDHLEFLVNNFLGGEYKSVLDVGCDEGYLRQLLKPQRYVGIDVTDKADLRLDLDKIDRLPFSDGEFDLAFCSNLIEHLENIHLAIDEIIRVGKLSFITTPPSANWDIFGILLWKKRYKEKDRKKFGKHFKYYGLPLEKPLNRHRWFFLYDEIVELVKYRAEKQGKNVEVFERYTSKKRKFMGVIFGKELFANEVIFKIS
jgi:SAM-dependent methyltransferase